LLAAIMSDHDAQATEHLEKALAEGAEGPWLHVAAAGIHAVMYVADTIRHGLRDIVYELRD
jgi:phosphatidylethanolamine-binding protein (PEBP) family uncharacterized protein